MVKKNITKKNNFKNSPLKEVLIEQIDSAFFKKKVYLNAFVEKIIQTSGPTIFEVSDGTGNLSLKGFVSPGVRAFSNIKEGNCIKAIIKIEEFNGSIEGEIVKIFVKTDEDSSFFKKQVDKRLREKAKVDEVDFLVDSVILDKLKSSFLQAALEIRLAVLKNRPIIVRHHNDTDGYCAGFALERAILPLMEKQHLNPKASWEYFTRAPCSAPFYEIDDSIRDTTTSLRNVAKFSDKMPLIIIVDNGSGEEDLMGIKQGKVHGSDFIVIDHHGFNKDVITDEVLVHINPFLVGESGSSFSAGMLCAEVARFINKDVNNINQLPAIAGLADRIFIENPEVINKYLKIAEKEGYTKEMLNEISLVMEYVSAKIKFMEAREYIEVLFGEPRDKQKNLVKLMAPYIKDLDEKGLLIGKSNAIIEKKDDLTLQIVHIEESFPGFGFFPKPGRAVGLLHDDLQYNKKLNSLISIGVMNTAMTFRATTGANFSIHDLIIYLNKKVPEAFIEGGGHKNAGSISFLPKYKDEVLKLVKEFVYN